MPTETSERLNECLTAIEEVSSNIEIVPQCVDDEENRSSVENLAASLRNTVLLSAYSFQTVGNDVIFQ